MCKRKGYLGDRYKTAISLNSDNFSAVSGITRPKTYPITLSAAISLRLVDVEL